MEKNIDFFQTITNTSLRTTKRVRNITNIFKIFLLHKKI
ncbi:PTS system IIA 2 domain-containing protein [Listeria monocytogenes]|nr:PTS system IIA 2 domain-containing protein [Listeria monocytogenes]